MGKKLFRPHRGQLDDAMKEVEEVNDWNGLVEVVRKGYSGLLKPEEITRERLTVKPYGYDARIQWDTHIVNLENVGVVGFTNFPLE